MTWPLTGPYHLLARLTLTAPLGLRFRDEATGKFVGDGLRVIAYPSKQSAKRIEAQRSRSGIYGFAHLPGLNGIGNDDFGQSSAPPQDFVLEVIDTERRFLPFRCVLSAPHHQVYEGEDLLPDSLPAEFPGIPLFSSPARTPPAGLAVLRTELRVAGTTRAAAWALVEARLNGRLLARGLADEAGRVALFFPWPAMESLPLLNPSLPGSGAALDEQAWTIQVRAFYQQLQATAPTPGWPALPELRSLLAQIETPAVLWADTNGLPWQSSTLRFGAELQLGSREAITQKLLPYLLLVPTG